MTGADEIPVAVRSAVPPPGASANPLITEEQTEVTARALRIAGSPEYQRGRQAAEFKWKLVLKNDPPAEAWPQFDAMIEEYAFNYAMKAANGDPNYPKVAQIYTPPRLWKGMQVPGSRWGGDNPNNIYRIIPIDGKSRYRLDGRRIGKGPADVSYSLVSSWETTNVLATLSGRDVKVKPDGTFSITLDPDPANGRDNHIRTWAGAVLLFVRDSLSDWNETANALTIHRLDPPDGPALTDQQVAEHAAEIMVNGVAQVYYFLRSSQTAPNEMTQFPDEDLGGLASAKYSTSHAILDEDDALVITLQPAGAAYFDLVAHNYWYITMDYANRMSSSVNGQVERNSDGTVTYVVARTDPGVHNWVDTVGQQEAKLLIRLQALPSGPNKPWVKTHLVKLSELRDVLPAETKWVTPEQRAAQIAQRQAQIRARLADE